MVNQATQTLLEDLCSKCAPECNTKKEFLSGNYSPPSNGHYCSLRKLFSLTGINSEGMIDPYFRRYMLKQVKCIEHFKFEKGICDESREENDKAWELAYLLWVDDSKGKSLATRFAQIYKEKDGDNRTSAELYSFLMNPEQKQKPLAA